MIDLRNVGVVFHLNRSNDDALGYAEDLVVTNKGQLHIYCPVPSSIADDELLELKVSLQEMLKVPFEFRVLQGVPQVSIVDAATEDKLDILITEPDETGAVTRFFYGSLTLSILRKAPCPVWVVNKSRNETYQRVLIAVDLFQSDEVSSRLNTGLVEIGSAFAKKQGAECHLVSVWKLDIEDTLHSPFLNIPQDKIDTLVSERNVECLRIYNSFVAEHESMLQDVNSQLVHGEASRILIDYIEDNKIDIIIMGTHARAGIKGFVIGNTAESLINQIDCSIIAVKPDIFNN